VSRSIQNSLLRVRGGVDVLALPLPVDSSPHAAGIRPGGPGDRRGDVPPATAAVLVLDAQAGIPAHVRDRDGLVERIIAALHASRGPACRSSTSARVAPAVPHGRGGPAHRHGQAAEQAGGRRHGGFSSRRPHTRIAAELAPAAGQPLFDKLGVSALVGTPIEAVLRDRGMTTLVLVGAVLKIGIEPTARHAADFGFLPVVVDNSCGVVRRLR
jgi:biuret amidohydrolase